MYINVHGYNIFQANSEDEPNSLSKYFSLPVENASIDSEGIQFFDALAENSQSAKSLEITTDNLETTVKVNENIEQVNTDILPSEPLTDQAAKTTSDGKYYLKFLNLNRLMLVFYLLLNF